MKITSATNDTIEIQARNEADYEQAYKIAQRMVENNDGLAIASVDEDDLWIMVCTDWDNFNAKQLRDEYSTAKKEVK